MGEIILSNEIKDFKEQFEDIFFNSDESITVPEKERLKVMENRLAWLSSVYSDRELRHLYVCFRHIEKILEDGDIPESTRKKIRKTIFDVWSLNEYSNEIISHNHQ